MHVVDEIAELESADPKLEDKAFLIEHAAKIAELDVREETLRLKEDYEARHALMKTLKPAEQGRIAQHLVQPPGTRVLPRPDLIRPPSFCLEYQVLRPPFTALWGVPPRASVQCVNAQTGQPVGIRRWSQEGIGDQGALSIEAAIGEFIGVDCQPSGPWFIGEANQTNAVLGQFHYMGGPLTLPAQVTVEADLVLEGLPSAWTYLMVPGQPSSGLGLVGFLGVANLFLYGWNGTGVTVRNTYHRFLLGAASAFYPGEVDRDPSFTLSESISIRPNPNNPPLAYALLIRAELTAFRSVPTPGGGAPGYAQANLTVPGTPAALGQGTPLMVKEIRSSICLPWI